jgi:drug/metabolite transporter (DMT)-like permease
MTERRLQARPRPVPSGTVLRQSGASFLSAIMPIDALKRVFPHSAGILLSISGYFVFSFQDATVKWLVADHPVMQVLFMRSITIVLLCLLLGRGRLVRQALGSRNKGPLLLRGAFILAAWYCYYTASRAMPLAQLVTLYFATPLIVTVMSVLFLKEQVRWQRWAGVALGLFGVIIACDPGRVGITLPAALVLLGACFWAYTNILVRQISRYETTVVQMLFSNAAFAVACGMTLPWLWVQPSLGELALMMALGLIGAAGQFLLFEGFRLAAASLVAPFEYTSLVWAFCLSYLIWGDIPRLQVFLGAGLIIASGMLVVLGEWQARRKSPALATETAAADLRTGK